MNVANKAGGAQPTAPLKISAPKGSFGQRVCEQTIGKLLPRAGNAINAFTDAIGLTEVKKHLNERKIEISEPTIRFKPKYKPDNPKAHRTHHKLIQAAVRGDDKEVLALYQELVNKSKNESRLTNQIINALRQLEPNELAALRNNVARAKRDNTAAAKTLGVIGSLDAARTKSIKKLVIEHGTKAFEKCPSADFRELCQYIRDDHASIRNELTAKGIASKDIQAIAEMAEYGLLMKNDNWKADFIKNIITHRLEMRDAGVFSGIEGKKYDIDIESGDLNNPNDPNAKSFEGLRGPGSATEKLATYMKQHGGSYSIISTWTGLQAAGSWVGPAQAVKYTLAQQRDAPMDNYWFQYGVDEAEREQGKFCQQLANIGITATQEGIEASLTMAIAFHCEMLKNIHFEGNNNERATVTIMRTENKAVIANAKPTIGENQYRLKRGPAESGSIGAPVSVYGSELTTQEIAYHRILFSFIPGSSADGEYTNFLQNEKEFVFMGDDISFNYNPITPEK